MPFNRKSIFSPTSSTINPIAATINTSATERAAQGDVIRAAYTREQSVTAVTPSMTIPEGADQTVDNQTMTLNSTASVKIPWTGEDIKHVNNGAGFNTIYGFNKAIYYKRYSNYIGKCSDHAIGIN